ncbi:MFP1 attachment factor 1-like [Pyrus x bretschneideri]|uniref:MFP1 attachment factor 1-like n=1 Tax=Pyrus x bretschneideri TaxID=225117 RepID=UPI00202F5D76|nr:MFP1 attachment factor 1-like [Pyrus x bretschneideri]
MSDSEGTAVASPQDQTSAMEPESEQQKHHDAPAHKEKPSVHTSFSIWPPTQRTRDAVVNRLIETLTTPSPLSKRYGTMTADEASDTARLIEEDAFAAAGGSAATEEDGIQILQVYSKEISKRMLDSVKSRNAAASPAQNGAAEPETASSAVDPTAAAASEDAMAEE